MQPTAKVTLELDARRHLSDVLRYKGGDLVHVFDVLMITAWHVYDVPTPLTDSRSAGLFQPNPHDERLTSEFQNVGRLLQDEMKGTTRWSARTSFYRLAD
jgi:hypothetical protein